MSNKGTKVGTETGQGNGADTEEVLSTRTRHQANTTPGSKARMVRGSTRLRQACRSLRGDGEEGED